MSSMLQLDHNRIVIRERGMLELLDLALWVIRAYAWPLAVTLMAGILPFAVLNVWLLADVVQVDYDQSGPPFPAAYMWWMLVLVVWETPLATALATLYLGEAVFQERPRAGSIARAFLGALPQLFLYQVVLRGLLMPMVVTWFVPYAIWPHLNEVILLERNPLRRRHPGQMTTFRRSNALHRGSAGDLFGRWLATVALGALLFLSLWVSMIYAAETLSSNEDWQTLAFTLLYPLALWMVVGYFTVVRFLGYLDLRIRREGWEVELMMRAEGARLTRQLT